MKGVARLAKTVRGRATGQGRLLVAVAGPPGSGKTTLAHALGHDLGPDAAVVPMDGFHLDNETLRARGLFERKGAPETFDVEGFARLIAAIREDGDIAYPTFDRAADSTVPGGGHLVADARIVVVEGNYLLMNTPPWSMLADAFDLTIWLDVPTETLRARLIDRWLAHGLSAEAAEKRAVGNDLRNAMTAIAKSRAADIVFRDGEVQNSPDSDNGSPDSGADRAVTGNE